MKYEDFRRELFRLALENGCTAAETYKKEGEEFSVGILSQEIDSYSVSRTLGISLRVQKDGKDGYAYTECIENPAALVQRAIDNALAVETADEHPMQGPQVYPAIEQPEDPIAACSEAERIELAKKLEQAVLSQGEPVVRCESTEISLSRAKVSLHNTRGLAVEETRGCSLLFTSPIVQKGEEVQNDYAFSCRSTDLHSLAEKAVRQASSRLGASPVEPGRYRILLQGRAAFTLLQAFSPIFCADRVQKGLSPLREKVGQTVASPQVTLLDDPFDPGMPLRFDDEGTPAQPTVLLQEGKLCGFLHNLKTAKKNGVSSTGNGIRPGGAASPVGVAPTNLIWQPGAFSPDELVQQLDTGLIITSMSGIHAGVNPISGSFSLLSSGFWVEKGQIVRPVDRITVAGSFPELLQKVQAVGKNLTFSFPGTPRYGAPDVLIESLNVAGS